jgi:hypothetical protein
MTTFQSISTPHATKVPFRFRGQEEFTQSFEEFRNGAGGVHEPELDTFVFVGDNFYVRGLCVTNSSGSARRFALASFRKDPSNDEFEFVAFFPDFFDFRFTRK